MPSWLSFLDLMRNNKPWSEANRFLVNRSLDLQLPFSPWSVKADTTKYERILKINVPEQSSKSIPTGNSKENQV